MFFLALPFSTLNTHDQTVEVSIAPPTQPTCSHSDSYEEDSDMIVLSEPGDPDSDEDITVVSVRPAPGPSGSAMAIPHASDESDEDITTVSVRLAPGPSGSAMAIPHAGDDIDISESEPESEADLEDISVSWFDLSLD